MTSILTDPRSAAALRRAWRRLGRQTDAAGAPLSIGLAASFTIEPLAPLVGALLADAGFAPAVHPAPHNQLLQVCADPAAALGEAPDALVLLWQIQDLLREDLGAFLAGDDAALPAAAAKTDDLAAAVRRLRARTPATLVTSLPSFPCHPCLRPAAPLDSLRAAAFFRTITARWQDGLQKTDPVHVLDLDALEREVGSRESRDARKAYLYRQPFSDAFLVRLARELAHWIARAHQPPKKCAVLDCDDTLWGGVVGEDGLAGIALGDAFPGRAYAEFQEWLLHWHNRGVLLALASKNNEADVWEVFDKHDAMRLQRAHLAAWRIDWRPKDVSLPELAAELNLDLESFVLFDDNPVEIDRVRRAHPQVACVQLPTDPARLLATVQAAAPFERLGTVTDEDAGRTRMMAEERERQALRQTLTETEYLATLQVEVLPFEAEAEHMERVAQLINKTNQFNLTTHRRTREQVQALAAASDWRVLAARVRDRFGDYGITSVALIKLAEETAQLDTFLLSCRVLGRGVETSFLAAVAAAAADAGAARMQAWFLPTDKNAPAQTFLPDHGFQQAPDGSWWADVTPLSAPAPPAPPAAPRGSPRAGGGPRSPETEDASA